MQAMDKVERVLGIYTKLINGAVVNKTQTANEYGVNERSIQRDIDDIPEEVKKDLTIIPVKNVMEVINRAIIK